MPDFSERSAGSAWNVLGWNIQDDRFAANADYALPFPNLSIQPGSGGFFLSVFEYRSTRSHAGLMFHRSHPQGRGDIRLNVVDVLDAEGDPQHARQHAGGALLFGRQL